MQWKNKTQKLVPMSKQMRCHESAVAMTENLKLKNKWYCYNLYLDL